MHTASKAPAYNMAGLFSLSLRLVVGWTYFSAFWRRVALENKLDPEVQGYIGAKFNHFLPNALGIKPMIEYLVTHPDALWWAMVIFTIVEGIVGLAMMLGFATRLMSVGVFMLAMGILLGSGWIGTTCLDEWQIGILGLAAGFTVFLTGGGSASLDAYFSNRRKMPVKNPRRAWLFSGPLPWPDASLRKLALAGSGFILFMTLMTNQVFHGGVWGTLHNKSVRPKPEMKDAQISGNVLSFEVYRVEGADVYGSFLIGIALNDAAGNPVFSLDGTTLSKFPKSAIQNRYVAQIAPGKHSLVIPLGAKAVLQIPNSRLDGLPAGNYELVLTDISGLTWKSAVTVAG